MAISPCMSRERNSLPSDVIVTGAASVGGTGQEGSVFAVEHRHFRLSIAAGLILAVLASSHAAADPVRVPGTRTSLEPPKGFSLSTRFPGFERAEAQASIMVSEIP